MFLTDHYTIKEVLTFPFMKDIVEDKKPAAEVVDVTPKPTEGIRKYKYTSRILFILTHDSP